VKSEQLLTQGKIFEDEILAGPECTNNPAEEVPEPYDHAQNLTGTLSIELGAKSLILRVYDVLMNDRFRDGAQDYAAYLETPEGRLRTDLAFANLQEFLPTPQAMKPMYVLDVGCGTGSTAVRLARLGFHVTQLDSSPAMLDIARRTAEEAGVTNRVTLQHGDAAQLTNLFSAESFDVVLCHNILEYADDPAAVLRGAARALRGSSAILSIVVRNQAGEVFKAAIQAGDLAAAEANLTAEWGFESLYGGRVRLFNPPDLHAMLNAGSLTLIAERGVRVLADYLPLRISRRSEYARILEPERSSAAGRDL
jgi:2-polyprenyl-3-methyl-5-hydroxy-6-metoxy-1,4-benzoquinol methylase